MRHTQFLLALGITATLAVSGAAHAASPPCNAQISNAGPIAAISYDPFDGVARDVTFAVEFTNNGADACTLSLAVKSQATGSSRYFKNGAQQLLYVVEWPDGSDFPNDINAPQGSISLPAGVGKTKTITLRVKVPAGLMAPAKTYSDLLSFRAFKAGTSTQSKPARK
ncbi:MAG: hypothetical protein K8S25_05670 [Alphaproteobacteria bacterium]|nr:hypothetical protein [Alphaproteobacteria bacterium]